MTFINDEEKIIKDFNKYKILTMDYYRDGGSVELYFFNIENNEFFYLILDGKISSETRGELFIANTNKYLLEDSLTYYKKITNKKLLKLIVSYFNYQISCCYYLKDFVDNYRISNQFNDVFGETHNINCNKT